MLFGVVKKIAYALNGAVFIVAVDMFIFDTDVNLFGKIVLE